MNDILKRIAAVGIVPVIKVEKAETALPLCRALMAGGLPCAEITFRTDAAAEAIALVRKELPDMITGAGTVTKREQVDSALEAGAQFAVCPGFNPRIVAYCVEKGLPVTPGCSGPSDIEQAMEFGLEVVKFFPAEAMGGVKTIKALSGPYSGMKFIPTGGVNPGNLGNYLAFDRVIACGGSWMVDQKLVAAGDFEGITRLTREAMHTMLGFELAHVGINCENEQEAERTARFFCKLMGLEYRAGNSSVFAGGSIEAVKTNGLGKNGHIAVNTNSLERAIAYLETQGFEFDPATEKFDASGKRCAIYLKGEAAGFAVHLAQKKK